MQVCLSIFAVIPQNIAPAAILLRIITIPALITVRCDYLFFLKIVPTTFGPALIAIAAPI